MSSNTLPLLLTAKINRLYEGANDTNYIDNDRFTKLHSIINEITSIIYKILLKDFYHSKRTDNNFKSKLSHEDLSDGSILISVYFEPPETFDTTTNVEPIIRDILYSAAEILIIEHYAHKYDYIYNPHLDMPHTWNALSSPPTINFKHPATISLTNKIERLINEMHSFDDRLEIEINIFGEKLLLLPVEASNVSKKISQSKNPEILEGYVIQGSPKNGESTFSFKKNGSNKAVKISDIKKIHMEELADKAKDKSHIKLSVFQTFRTVRGLTENNNKLLLDKIIHMDDTGQISLI